MKLITDLVVWLGLCFKADFEEEEDFGRRVRCTIFRAFYLSLQKNRLPITNVGENYEPYELNNCECLSRT
jgi:hypothetical protein